MNRHIHVLWRKTEVLEGVQGDGWEVDASQQEVGRALPTAPVGGGCGRLQAQGRPKDEGIDHCHGETRNHPNPVSVQPQRGGGRCPGSIEQLHHPR